MRRVQKNEGLSRGRRNAVPDRAPIGVLFAEQNCRRLGSTLHDLARLNQPGRDSRENHVGVDRGVSIEAEVLLDIDCK